ncbi:hypothetical protein ScPMuIL_006699 [Solemya velum]
MGARANKALGLGATRGRLYIKHPDIFKYSGDQDDKQWLYENHHMPATGGKAYMLVLNDIKELADTEEYRESPGLLLHELFGFPVPEWMLEKIKIQMTAMRTDMIWSKPYRSRSATPTEVAIKEEFLDVKSEDATALPFSTFGSPKGSPILKQELQVTILRNLI